MGGLCEEIFGGGGKRERGMGEWIRQRIGISDKEEGETPNNYFRDKEESNRNMLTNLL